MNAEAVHALLRCRTLGEALRALTGLLSEAGVDEAATDARALVCAAIGATTLDLALRPDQIADAASMDRLAGYARRRLAREPVTRILGRRGFWSLDLEVHEDVLDPRPDTEAVVEACLAALGERVRDPLRILDVGTGSGALLAALLIEAPAAHGWGVDLSPAATRAAKANMAGLGLAGRSTILLQSWSEPTPVRFDLVVSNPPYIESAAIPTLDPEVRRFDPALALDGGADGLDAYRSIASCWKSWLKPDGLLVLEIGLGQAEPVASIFKAAGGRLLGLRKDYAGRDRALVWTKAVV